MQYELANELKAAGFPQKSPAEGTKVDLKAIRTVGIYIGPEKDRDDPAYAEEIVYIPTLSELTEACGDRFITLEHPTSGDPAARQWYAIAKGDQTPWPHGIGTTPEEAVARLWLALNSSVRTPLSYAGHETHQGEN
jgi:hypothetical protein